MTLRHLKIFSEVCRLESITLAAEEMNMAQPAVSYAIRELESYYETKLFERMNRRLYITEAGEQLLIYADSILAQFDEARDVLRDIQTVTKVRVGTNASYGISRLPELIAGFKKNHGNIPVYTLVDNSRQIEERLMRNDLDFGITDYPSNPQFFISVPIATDRMAAVCSSDYNIGRSVTTEELAAIPLLLRELGSGSRSLVESLLNKYKRKPEIVMESISIRSLIEACSKGMGILILTKSVLESYMESHQLREIEIVDENIMREYYFVYHKSKFLTKSMKCFQEFVLDQREILQNKER